MLGLIRKIWTQPIRADDYVYFQYTDKLGRTTNRFVRVIEVYRTYVHCYCFTREAFRNFNQVRMTNVRHPNWKSLKKTAKRIGVYAT
jgi:predicted DNA-binding transcriptional regulator YafY